jgi:hypothetical protein
LERIKSHFIRGEVIIQYTLVDEFLNLRLVNYFFGKRSSIKLWRTKKFKNFNYYVLEGLSLMEKLRFARAIKPIPKSILADIERLNSLRNGVTPAFFPENLRSSKPTWKRENMFSVAGIARFIEDTQRVTNFLVFGELPMSCKILHRPASYPVSRT